MQIVIECVVVQYSHEREENYHELIVVEIRIDESPRKFANNHFHSKSVRGVKNEMKKKNGNIVELTSSNRCFTLDCTLSYCLERQSDLAGVA